MKLLLAALLATAVLAINKDEISHALRSMREEISELKAHYKQLKAENRALGAENKALRSDVDELKTFSHDIFWRYSPPVDILSN
jgi:cell division protein FtsB